MSESKKYHSTHNCFSLFITISCMYTTFALSQQNVHHEIYRKCNIARFKQKKIVRILIQRAHNSFSVNEKQHEIQQLATIEQLFQQFNNFCCSLSVSNDISPFLITEKKKLFSFYSLGAMIMQDYICLDIGSSCKQLFKIFFWTMRAS